MKTRKLLAIVLAVAMLASFVSIPVFADGHEGEVLETLGILIGVDDEGVTEDYLESMATRAQAALIHLRLFGLEEEALASKAQKHLPTQQQQPLIGSRFSSIFLQIPP
jgi:hypothetical protein